MPMSIPQSMVGQVIDWVLTPDMRKDRSVEPTAVLKVMLLDFIY